MNWKVLIKRIIGLSVIKIKLHSYLLFSVLVCLLSINFVFPQDTEYTVIGRVVDEKKQPLAKTDVRLAPIYNLKWKNSDLINISNTTDQEGRFLIIKKIKKGDTWYLYVSDGSNTGRIFINPPFYFVNNINKNFLGKPITFADKKIIDVGDVNVQFWFADISIRFQNKGKNLSKVKWESLWCRIKDNKGKIVWEESIGPTINNDIDLQKSIIKLSLPEGKWKLEFQKFDYDKNKIYPKIIGQTPYFMIDKDKYPETIDVLTQCSKCF